MNRVELSLDAVHCVENRCIHYGPWATSGTAQNRRDGEAHGAVDDGGDVRGVIMSSDTD